MWWDHCINLWVLYEHLMKRFSREFFLFPKPCQDFHSVSKELSKLFASPPLFEFIFRRGGTLMFGSKFPISHEDHLALVKRHPILCGENSRFFAPMTATLRVDGPSL